jgi:hypothetical protein
MASLVDILNALDQLPEIIDIIRRMERQVASEQDVIGQINDLTTRLGGVVTTMASDTRTVADRLAALQGAITSGNQAAVAAAMDSIAPELGKMSAMGDQLDTVGAALHGLASDPNNPTETGVPMSALAAEDSGGDVEVSSPPSPPANGGEDTSGNPAARGPAAADAAPEATAGSNAQGDTGAPSAPDVTGPTNTAVGGPAEVEEGTAAGMPTGGTVDTSQAGGGIGSASAPPGTDPPGTTVGDPNTAP